MAASCLIVRQMGLVNNVCSILSLNFLSKSDPSTICRIFSETRSTKIMNANCLTELESYRQFKHPFFILMYLKQFKFSRLTSAICKQAVLSRVCYVRWLPGGRRRLFEVFRYLKKWKKSCNSSHVPRYGLSTTLSDLGTCFFVHEGKSLSPSRPSSRFFPYFYHRLIFSAVWS